MAYFKSLIISDLYIVLLFKYYRNKIPGFVKKEVRFLKILTFTFKTVVKNVLHVVLKISFEGSETLQQVLQRGMVPIKHL